MNEIEQLKQRMYALEQRCSRQGLELFVMHRALLRCQARTWCLADQPRGWKAIWVGIKDLMVSKKRRQKEREELIQATPSCSIYLDQTPPVGTQDKKE